MGCGWLSWSSHTSVAALTATLMRASVAITLLRTDEWRSSAIAS